MDHDDKWTNRERGGGVVRPANNGNQTSRGTDTFGYNAENRLTSTNLGGTFGSYVYNGDGLRTSRTIGGTTTTFAWGNATGMPVILRDGAGNRYLYGLDLISLSDSGNHKFYYHTDGLGSTTAITNSSGTVVKTYQYDVFGAIRVQTGTQPNEFTFTGEQVDTSGLEYLRARFYDNATGRFLIRDTAAIAPGRTQILDPYVYVANNPTSYVDPSGLWCPRNPEDCVPHQVKKFVTKTAKALTTGYVDIGFWGCTPLVEVVGPCVSFGTQVGWGQGLHIYVGGGLGTAGGGVSVSPHPHQRIVQGWSCGVTGGAPLIGPGAPLVGPGVGIDFGRSGIGNKEGAVYEGGGLYLGTLGVAGLCTYVGSSLF